MLGMLVVRERLLMLVGVSREGMSMRIHVMSGERNGCSIVNHPIPLEGGEGFLSLWPGFLFRGHDGLPPHRSFFLLLDEDNEAVL